MADAHMAPTAGRFEVRVTSDSHFSWVRTRLSLERTMMSWQRTAVALIGFGILALVISIWQYRWSLRYLWGEPFTPIAGVTKEGKQTPVTAVAIVLILIGLFAFFAVLLRLT